MLRRVKFDFRPSLTSFTLAKLLDDVKNDLKSLSINIVKAALENNVEFNKWVTFAENFLSNHEACSKDVSQLNEYLSDVLVGGGSTPSEADIIFFSTVEVHPYVISLSISDNNKLPRVMRWMDYIQNKHELRDLFEWIVVEKTPFDPLLPKPTTKVEAESSSKKFESSVKKAEPHAKASGSKAGTEKKSDVIGVDNDNKAEELL